MDSFTDIKDDEKIAIKELREKMKDDMEPEMYEDIILFYRFLKARDFDLNRAENMLREHVKWRQRIDLTNFSLPEVLEKYFSYNFLGYDKEGSVIRYSAAGNMDPNGFINSMKFEDMEKTMAYFGKIDEDRLKSQSQKLKRNVRGVAICNLENLSFKTLTDKKAFLVGLRLYMCFEKNYPDRLKAIYVYNGSAYFTLLRSIAKRILPASILEKIHLYSDDSWKEDILKEVDADVLPAFLGGTRTDPDGNPLCLTFINHGGRVPEEYYIRRSKGSLSDTEGVKKITLTNASFHEEMVEVKECGSYLEWEFETKCRDIGFGLFYEDATEGEGKMIPLLPIQRIDTDEYSESGGYLCEQIGKYVILFDNSYSWIRGKEIYYKVNIISAKEVNSRIKNP